MADTAGCAMCELAASLDAEAIAYRDDDWTVGLAVDVPGWLMLIANGHVEGVDGLDDEQAASFGVLAARVTRALRTACDPERVYLTYQGEHAAHFHALAMARGRDIPPEHRGMALLAHRDALTDPAGARRVVAAVREHLEGTER
jgi:diadenosine tetraphosphate (Ap4A) HIT family hydrolase